MRMTEMVLFAPFLKTSKFIPACISIYILSLGLRHWLEDIEIRKSKFAAKTQFL